MAYDDARKSTAREHFWIVDIHGKYCALNYGESPCAAAIGETGTSKCFNTLASCQDAANYTEEDKVYRHCSQAAFVPVELDAVPDIASVDIQPTVMRPDGGLGVRANASISFVDHPGSDIGIDKYVLERDYTPEETGTYWGKWRARNPYYTLWKVDIYSGYIVDDAFDISNFSKRTYQMEKASGPSSGVFSLKAQDPLKSADDARAQVPLPSPGQLSAAMTDADTSFSLSMVADADSYPLSGFVRVESEVLGFTRIGDVFTVTRGAYNTVVSAHDEGATVQLCYVATSATLSDTLEDILVNYTPVDSSYIQKAEWDSEASEFLPGLITGIITEPTGVNKILKELGQEYPHQLVYDERNAKIKMIAVKEPGESLYSVDDDKIKKNTFSVRDDPEQRFSQVVIHFGQIDPTKAMDDASNYRQTYWRADIGNEARYKSSNIKTIYSRWITQFNKSWAVYLASLTGRRFAQIPQRAKFALSAQHADFWTGDIINLQHREMPSLSGMPVYRKFQILSTKESQQYQFDAIEYTYQAPLDSDPGTGQTFYLASDTFNVNLREAYGQSYPVDGPIDLTVIIESGVVIGSTSISEPSLTIGEWPTGTTITIVGSGTVVGKGGDGGVFGGSNWNGTPGQGGGPALFTRMGISVGGDVRIWGGGGGGGGGGGAYAIHSSGAALSYSTAGGGAGALPGEAQYIPPPSASNLKVCSTSGTSGSLEIGGVGTPAPICTNGSAVAIGGNPGNGGAPGEAGQNGGNGFVDGWPVSIAGVGAAGGLPGPAIDGISYVTIDGVDVDLRGPVIN